MERAKIVFKKCYTTFVTTYFSKSHVLPGIYGFLQTKAKVPQFPVIIFKSKLFFGFENPWTLDF